MRNATTPDDRFAAAMNGKSFGSPVSSKKPPLSHAQASAAAPAIPLGPNAILLGALEGNKNIGVSIDLPKLLEGRLLIQGVSGAGKSWTMRRLLEQCAGRIQQLVIDPEGEFKTLADELGYLYVQGHTLNCPALGELARRVRKNRISVVIDLSEVRREDQMRAVAAIFHALVECPQDMWHPAIVAVDEAHLFAPLGTQGQEASSVRKASIAAFVDLMSRGRKRGLAGVLATQRLARLSKSVASEVHNFLIGMNTLDLDVKRAAETIGWDMRKAYDRLPLLRPGEFVATGPAFSLSPVEISIGEVKSRHIGAAPQLAAVEAISAEDAHSALALDELVEQSRAGFDENMPAAFKAVRGFIRDPAFPLAAQIFESLRPLQPDGTTIDGLAKHHNQEKDAVIAALVLLESFAAVEIKENIARIEPKFFWEKQA